MFSSRFMDFDDKILYLCDVYLAHINLAAVTLRSFSSLIHSNQVLIITLMNVI